MSGEQRPLQQGDRVRVIRGKHRGRVGIVKIWPYDRRGYPLRSVRIAYTNNSADDVWHSRSVLEQVDE